MLRFVGRLLGMLLFLSACATVANAPRLSQATVRRIADAEARRTMKIDLRHYEISGPHYNSKGDSWSVAYHRKAKSGGAFTVRVSDKIQKASIDKSGAGIFEGDLSESPDYH